MAITAPSDYKTAKVTWTIAHQNGTTLDGATGTVLFTPTLRATPFSTVTVLPAVVETPVKDGIMTPVDLTVNDPGIWNWKVEPKVGIRWDAFHVDVTGPTNLATAAVTPGVGPVRAVQGIPGDSAYEVAVANGYRGTEAEWIASIPTRVNLSTAPAETATGAASVQGGALNLSLGLPRGPKGDRGPEGPYGGTEVTDPQVASMVTTTTQTRDALDRGYRRGVSVLEYGAVGDGVTDDAPAIRAALADADGATVHMPARRYRIASAIQMGSGQTLTGQPGTVIDATGLPTAVRIAGSIGTPVALSTAVGTGATTIKTAVPHGLAVGDVVQLQSQRVATSADAGDWRLGFSTGTLPGPVFGEFNTVAAVTDARTVELTTGLIFPGYRPDATQETDPGARDAATIARVDAVSNSVVSGVSIEGTTSIAIVVSAAVDCLVDSVRFDQSGETKFVQLVQCFRTEVRDCWTRSTATSYSDHDRINSYHCVASQASGFDRCTAIGGTQAFDLTYQQAARTPSVFCYVRNCRTTFARFNAMTVHPGVYAPIITGNDFSDCLRYGISNRGNRALISGNVVRGSGIGYGIAITEGSGRESLITSNVISGFDIATAMLDSGAKTFNDWCGLQIIGNVITNCKKGFRRYREPTAPDPTRPEGIVFADNLMTSDISASIGVEVSDSSSRTWGIVVQGNRFNLRKSSNSTALYLRVGARDVSFIQNTIFSTSSPMVLDSTGDARWPDPGYVEVSGNRVMDASIAMWPTATPDFRIMSQDLQPMVVSKPQLDDYVQTIRLAASASADASVAAGFPMDASNGDVEVRRRSASQISQTFRSTAGAAWIRTWSTSKNGYGNWIKMYGP